MRSSQITLVDPKYSKCPYTGKAEADLKQVEEERTHRETDVKMRHRQMWPQAEEAKERPHPPGTNAAVKRSERVLTKSG